MPPEFTFMVDTIHKDPLSREIDEAIKIHECEAEFSTLNSKSEWNGTTLSRLCIEKSSWVRKKEAIDEMKKEAKNKEAVLCMKSKNNQVSFQSAVSKIKNRNEDASFPQHLKTNTALPDWPRHDTLHSSNAFNISNKSSFSRSAKRKEGDIATGGREERKKQKLLPATSRPNRTYFSGNEPTESDKQLVGRERKNSCFIQRGRKDRVVTKVNEKSIDSTESVVQSEEMLSVKVNHAQRAPAKRAIINLMVGEGECNNGLLSFDSCISDEVKHFLEMIRNNDGSQTHKAPSDGGSMLWEFREKLSDCKLDEDEVNEIDLTEVDWSSLGVDKDDSGTDYQHQISSHCQDHLVREMMAMEVNRKRSE